MTSIRKLFIKFLNSLELVELAVVPRNSRARATLTLCAEMRMLFVSFLDLATSL